MSIANPPEITPELVAEHGLKPDEWARFRALVGREPTLVELGIVSAMWNEHCSYKSSKRWLRTLPTDGPHVIQGPGENAGVVDIGDGLAVVFKMESHNHPSYIEPYQGAATGVGGILRDVFTMGARPVAALNALFSGRPEHPKTRHLVSGVVAGIGGYGNSFGVPTVGGMVEFDRAYDENCLVNAMAVGIASADRIFYSKARGVGMPVVYLGSKTGRDGIHGATMASAAFGEDAEEKRPTVQVGDPFAEKLLLEACLELMEAGAVIAIQDMGAAGLTSSAVEMGAKGGLGIRLDLDAVPCREEGMSAYEMMLSESQERMLMVLDPAGRARAEAIFAKWGLDFAVVGETTDTLRFVVVHGGEAVADLPIKALGDEAPSYDRPVAATPAPPPIPAEALAPPADPGADLLALLASPNGCSRRWVYEQYDHLVGGNTAAGPGGDAAVVRVPGTDKALALTVDVTPRYCAADPFEGGKQAVAEACRNLSAVGARPLAVTDNLNFASPERPEIMGTFARAVEGIGAACRALGTPVVSGNVSLYNETEGRAILPTPTIGAVGLLADVAARVCLAFARDGETVILLGGETGHLGQSLWLDVVRGVRAGPPPPVELAAEAAAGALVRAAIAAGEVSACHDVSSGGVGVALAEMAMAGGRGARVRLPGEAHRALFGEDQGRYLLAVPAGRVEAVLSRAKAASVPAAAIGETGGDELIVEGVLAISVEAMRAAHEGFFPRFMGGPA